MNINLVSSPASTTPPTKSLDLRLNRNADGTIVLEAQGTYPSNEPPGIATGWTTILTFPTGRTDGLLRLQRATNLSSLSGFINVTGGNGSILMIRAGDRD